MRFLRTIFNAVMGWWGSATLFTIFGFFWGAGTAYRRERLQLFQRSVCSVWRRAGTPPDLVSAANTHSLAAQSIALSNPHCGYGIPDVDVVFGSRKRSREIQNIGSLSRR